MIATSASTDVLRHGWLDAAATLAPDIPEIADLLGARLNDAIAAGQLSEAELMSTIAEVEATAARVGSSSGSLLARRLRRTVYEYLLALDANLAVEEQHAAAVAATARARSAAAAMSAAVPAVEEPVDAEVAASPLPVLPSTLSGDYGDTAALFAEFDDPARDSGDDDGGDGRRRRFSFRRRHDGDSNSSDETESDLPDAVVSTDGAEATAVTETAPAEEGAAVKAAAAEPADVEPTAAEAVAVQLVLPNPVATESPVADGSGDAPGVAEHAATLEHDLEIPPARSPQTAFELYVTHRQDDRSATVTEVEPTGEAAPGPDAQQSLPLDGDHAAADTEPAGTAGADSDPESDATAHDARFVAPRAGFHIVEDTDPGRVPDAEDDDGSRMFFRNTVTNDTLMSPTAPPPNPTEPTVGAYPPAQAQTPAPPTAAPPGEDPFDSAQWGVRNLDAHARRTAEAQGDAGGRPVAHQDDPFASDSRLFDLRRKIQDRLRRKRCDEAAALLQLLAQESGGRAVAELAMDAGDRCRGLGKNNAALNCYLAASRADPVFELPLSRLADICIDDQDIDLAVSYLERIARLHRMRGDERAALRVYRRLVTVAPYRDDILAMLMDARNNGNLGV
jgi:hypothetical protein